MKIKANSEVPASEAFPDILMNHRFLPEKLQDHFLKISSPSLTAGVFSEVGQVDPGP